MTRVPEVPRARFLCRQVRGEYHALRGSYFPSLPKSRLRKPSFFLGSGWGWLEVGAAGSSVTGGDGSRAGTGSEIMGGVCSIVSTGSSAGGWAGSSTGAGLASCSAPCVLFATLAVLMISETSVISGLSSTFVPSPRLGRCWPGVPSGVGWGPSVRLRKKTSL